MSMTEKVDELRKRKQQTSLGRGQQRIEDGKAKGKKMAADRISKLLDSGSFIETDAFTQSRSTDFDMASKRADGDGVICGYGKINNRPVFIASQDYSVLHGSVGEMHAKKIERTIDCAIKTGVPVIYLLDSDGARVEEGTDVLAGIGGVLTKQSMASGVIPQISVVLGNCAGISSLFTAMSDFVVMADKISCMYMNGPEAILGISGVKTTDEEIGSAATHATSSGNAHIRCENEDDCINAVKLLLSYLPDNNLTEALKLEVSDAPDRTAENLYETVADSYDMREVITSVTDTSTFMEIQSEFAASMITGFARMNGQSVGIVANNPAVNEGRIDMHAADKAARFVRLLDCFNIPIITFTHTSGYVADALQEKEGLIRHAAKMVYAFTEADVPKINIITGKAIGGAYIAMNSKATGCDIVFAYPTACVAVMDSEGAANIIYNEQIAKSDNPVEFRKAKIKEYHERFASPYEAAKRGYVDDVIDPAFTRAYVITALEMLKSKRENRPNRKHGNMPL